MASGKRRGRPPHGDILTPAEWKTTHAVQHGLTSRQIANRKGISRDGVKFHVENVLGKLGSIGQISRSVSDIRKAERWYGETLGLEHLYTFGNLAFFDCGGTRLLLTQADAPLAAESLLYFRVPQIQQAHEELKRRGIEF